MRRKRRYTGIERLESRRVLAVLVDIDMDGDLDLFESTTWYENTDGYGSLEGHSFSRFADAAAGDLDGDGDPDIATNRGWFENGDENLRHLIDLPTGFVPTKIELQDAGGDGDLDMIFFRENRAVLLLNDGAGSFEVGDDIIVERLADAADADNDGDLDALVVRDGEVIVMSNNGQGDFDKTVRYRDRESTVVDLALGWFDRAPITLAAEFGHVDSDGLLDVITVDGADALNNAWTHVTGEDSEKVWSCWHCDLMFDDVDLDGDVDILQDTTGIRTSVVSNRDNGQYEYLTGYSVFIDDFRAGGDINGDGIADIVTKDGIWFDGATQFGHLPGTTVVRPEPRATTFIERTLLEFPTEGLVHFDSDSQLDMLHSVEDSVQITFGSDNSRMALYAAQEDDRVRISRGGDIDDDGDQDVVFATDKLVGWIENLGDHEFSAAHEIATIDSPIELAIGDVTGDGSNDIVIADVGEEGRERVTVFEHDDNSFRSGGFSVGRLDLMALVDVDNDGVLNIFTENTANHHVWWKLEDGAFTRNYVRRVITDFGYEPLAFGDVNGDGVADLITATDDQLMWYDAVVGDERVIARADWYWSHLDVLDIDGDGDQDIVASTLNDDFSYRSNRLFSYTNMDGQGTFSDVQWFGYAPDFTSIQVIDYDNDGDDDIATFGAGGRNVLFESRRSGDSNNDGLVNSRDLIQVFQFGEYEDDVPRNSTFETGDWNGDQEFDSGDFVYLFSANTYEAAATRQQVAAAMAVDRFLGHADDDEPKSIEERLAFVP